MALKSRILAGDGQLEAAAVSNTAHNVPNAVGDHVAKIQQVLMALDGAVIDGGEVLAKRYGATTAAAVLAYKQKRNIINRSYQTQADNIVGIMTMAALDNELAEREKTLATESIRCDFSGRRGQNETA